MLGAFLEAKINPYRKRQSLLMVLYSTVLVKTLEYPASARMHRQIHTWSRLAGVRLNGYASAPGACW